MAIKLRDLADDRWLGILSIIKRGEDPKRENLVAALRRQDPTVPGEVQLYLAALLTGEVDRRGRPPLLDQTKELRAWGLIDRVERWASVFRDRYKKPNAQQMAFDRVSIERGWNPKTTERNYRAAKRLQKPWEVHGAPWKLSKIARSFDPVNK